MDKNIYSAIIKMSMKECRRPHRKAICPKTLNDGKRVTTMKRIISLCLTIVVLCCSGLPAAAITAPPDDVEAPPKWWGTNNEWYAIATYDLYYARILDGIVEVNADGGTMAQPQKEITRGEFMVLLRNLAKVAGKIEIDPEGSDPDNPAYIDVAGDVPKTYAGALDWAVQNQILKGTGSSLAENQVMTRQEMVTFLQRFADYIGMELADRQLPASFVDLKKAGDWAKDSLLWAYQKSVLNGTSKRSAENGDIVELSPLGVTNRAAAYQAVWNYADAAGIILPNGGSSDPNVTPS